MARGDEMVTFYGEVRHETEKAVLFWIEDLDDEVWFPLSQCNLSADETSIECPLWLARKKDLAD
jgi:hypothetical protein